MKQKILIVGANSALAKITQNTLAEKYEIITAGRKNCDIKIDITKDFEIPSDIDILINFAAKFKSSNDEEMKATIETNVLGTFNICKASKNIKLLILISSIFSHLSSQNQYYSSYSITKKSADEIAQFYCKQNTIPLLILRPSQLYGETDDFAKNQPLLYKIIENAKEGKNTTIYGLNDAKRNYIYSGDIAKIIKLSIEKNITGLYDCCFEKNISLSQIAKFAYQIFNKGGDIIFDSSKPNIADNVFVYDNTLYKKINYYPKTTIEQFFKLIKGREK